MPLGLLSLTCQSICVRICEKVPLYRYEITINVTIFIKYGVKWIFQTCRSVLTEKLMDLYKLEANHLQTSTLEMVIHSHIISKARSVASSPSPSTHSAHTRPFALQGLTSVLHTVQYSIQHIVLDHGCIY